MTEGENLSLAVAVYGFRSSTKCIEAAGLSYECGIIRDKLIRGECTLPIFKLGAYDSELTKEFIRDEDADDRSKWFDVDDAKYERYLMKLDPNDTKNQDHYKVLGLSKLRWKATMGEIRTCYRAKVLKHHPDKKKHRGEVLPAGEDYFTCITKAYEQIGMSEAKRQAFDSIDSKFSDIIPNEKSINRDNFFSELGGIFDLNSRWSTRQPVPGLGNLTTSRDAVENFYNFWFDFSSWREFSYLDEEDKERGEDRYERREMEKINKAERERRRKEEAKRIRRLVEMAYAKDPRIAQFKKNDQEAKEKAKEEKQRKQREKLEAIEKEKREREAEERKKKEEEEQRVKEEKDREKKEKEVAKKAAARQRKRFKKLAEEAGHWTDQAVEKLEEMERVERLCLSMSTNEMSELCDRIEKLMNNEEIRSMIKDAEISHKASSTKCEMKLEDRGKENDKSTVIWTNEENRLLIKAWNTYPSGTVDRWILISDYINEHRKDKSTPPKNEKQVIKQSKAVQVMAVKLPTYNQTDVNLPDDDVWTPSEQKMLEQAIRTYPAVDPDRWDKISIDVATKSKKACIRRFKYLVQMVKNKK